MVKFAQFHAEETNMWVERSTVFMISILRIHIFQSSFETTNYIIQALLKRMSKTPVASGLQMNVFSGSQIEPCKSWKLQDLIWRGLLIHSIFAKQATFVSFWFVYPHFDSTKEFGGPTHNLLDDGWSLVIVTFWMVKHRWTKFYISHDDPTQKCDASFDSSFSIIETNSAKLLAFENTWEGKVFLGERQLLEKKGSKNMEYVFEFFFFSVVRLVGVFQAVNIDDLNPLLFYIFFWVCTFS